MTSSCIDETKKKIVNLMAIFESHLFKQSQNVIISGERKTILLFRKMNTVRKNIVYNKN